MNRRYLLFGFGAAAIGGSLPLVRWFRHRFTPLPEFEMLADPKGFRKIAGGEFSLSGNVFSGIGEDRKAAHELPLDAVRRNICGSLFGSSSGNTDVVPIASFSDFYCPFCRVQTKRLGELERELNGEVQVTWHELPLLGDASLLAARAALAADRQNAYVQFQERLLSSPFRANDAYLAALSEAIGVNHDRLISDMNSPEVTQQIRESAALAKTFGFVGTPAMVVGRTVIQGEVSDAVLRKLVDLERTENWIDAC
ncbi:DsbA family protein [Mesobacterium pallidum]|uniref:DsbA family protein n=1 Tax=Mesobacterium pallidum TaxID=2872037 RepID=UPI001EE341B1|nr:DsbA family protein [Mesobacterium pallidum]